jgi:hypothetical protein
MAGALTGDDHGSAGAGDGQLPGHLSERGPAPGDGFISAWPGFTFGRDLPELWLAAGLPRPYGCSRWWAFGRPPSPPVANSILVSGGLRGWCAEANDCTR